MVGESHERQRHTSSSAFRRALQSARRSAAAAARAAPGGVTSHAPSLGQRSSRRLRSTPSEALLGGQDHITLWRMSLLMPGPQSEA